jgi:uncharacterized protein YbaP (TraB family)
MIRDCQFVCFAAAVLGLAATLLPVARAAEEPTDTVAALSEEPALEEVLVTGEHAGPGLWKVTRPSVDGDHVLWIFGTYGPLPKKMKWRSAELESAIATSQELITEAEVDPEIGVFARLSVLPSLIGIRDNPDGQRLQQVVPPQLYLRWVPLKARYLPRDDQVEEWRPLFAAVALYRAAVAAAGLERSTVVSSKVRKLARRDKLRITTPTVDVKVEKARAAVKDFKREPLADVDCFAKTIERLESDLGLMRERANAWATGDVEALRTSWPRAQGSACLSAVMSAQVVRERGLDDVPQRVEAAWLAAAERALRENRSTVAVLWMAQILDPDGYVAALRKRGYTVEDPR